jgi:3,4-dihydroxy 2-butanone 4-phosphate synthase/GTP cyclohydrolase II
MLRPTVTLSYAQSLDGSIAALRGEHLALRGEETMRMLHHLRAEHDAVLVGIGTVLAVDPKLTVRLVEGKNPQVIVLDTQLRSPVGAHVVRNGGWIVGDWGARRERRLNLEAAGGTVRLFSAENQQIPLVHLLTWLYEKNIRSLMVEGGARVITSFLRSHLVDRVVLTISPQYIGGVHALEKSHNVRLKNCRVSQLGDDIVIDGTL